MSRQSKNARKIIVSKQVTQMHLVGKRAGKQTSWANDENRGISQARRISHSLNQQHKQNRKEI